MDRFRIGDIVVREWDHHLRGRVMAYNARGQVFIRWLDGHKEATIENVGSLLLASTARAMDEADELTLDGGRDPEEAWR